MYRCIEPLSSHLHLTSSTTRAFGIASRSPSSWYQLYVYIVQQTLVGFGPRQSIRNVAAVRVQSAAKPVLPDLTVAATVRVLCAIVVVVDGGGGGCSTLCVCVSGFTHVSLAYTPLQTHLYTHHKPRVVLVSLRRFRRGQPQPVVWCS